MKKTDEYEDHVATCNRSVAVPSCERSPIFCQFAAALALSYLSKTSRRVRRRRECVVARSKIDDPSSACETLDCFARACDDGHANESSFEYPPVILNLLFRFPGDLSLACQETERRMAGYRRAVATPFRRTAMPGHDEGAPVSNCHPAVYFATYPLMHGLAKLRMHSPRS